WVRVIAAGVLRVKSISTAPLVTLACPTAHRSVPLLPSSAAEVTSKNDVSRRRSSRTSSLGFIRWRDLSRRPALLDPGDETGPGRTRVNQPLLRLMVPLCFSGEERPLGIDLGPTTHSPSPVR